MFVTFGKTFNYMSNLKPLSDIQEVRDLLFEKYLKIFNPPESFIEEIDCNFDKELEYIGLLKPMFMPYYIYKALEEFGFDLSDPLEERF